MVFVVLCPEGSTGTVCHAFASALWSHEGERADLLALICDVYCDFVTFPFGILGQVLYLIVSIPDPCCFSFIYCVDIFGGHR